MYSRSKVIVKESKIFFAKTGDQVLYFDTVQFGENDLNTQSARLYERGKSEKSSWKNASY